MTISWTPNIDQNFKNFAFVRAFMKILLAIMAIRLSLWQLEFEAWSNVDLMTKPRRLWARDQKERSLWRSRISDMSRVQKLHAICPGKVRMVMNPSSQKNKGFAFIRYVNMEDAKRALAELKDAQVKGKHCGVSPSQDNDKWRAKPWFYIFRVHFPSMCNDCVQMSTKARCCLWLWEKCKGCIYRVFQSSLWRNNGAFA